MSISEGVEANRKWMHWILAWGCNCNVLTTLSRIQNGKTEFKGGPCNQLNFQFQKIKIGSRSLILPMCWSWYCHSSAGEARLNDRWLRTENKLLVRHQQIMNHGERPLQHGLLTPTLVNAKGILQLTLESVTFKVQMTLELRNNCNLNLTFLFKLLPICTKVLK